jgi:photosystem II stability/assembly factor-like uncharacterized protein
VFLAFFLVPCLAPAQDAPAQPFAGLKFRALGPAVTSGRISSLAVHPKNRGWYYVSAASGGVWKTTNAGTTWSPVFDNEGSYSIGQVVLDPKNPDVVWVGTGENNSQRSVGFGDGVYRSDDAGKSWKKVGLEKSEHIGKILLDPRDSNTVYVAAQGPLWGPGGDRGLYKTTDGGKSWQCVLTVSANTGVTDVVLDPRNPDVLIAAAYQRRRHVWTLINGGPESALYKSTDAGKSWTKLKTGLPTVEMGRIGLAVASSSPDVVYAIIEAADKKGGIFRSNDCGNTWERRNEFDQQAQYYAHLVVDPKNSERIYVMNVFIQLSEDGGKTLRRLGERFKHVDNHTIWIDPNDTDFYRVGCDGGLYESFDRGKNWQFVSNLPITQFYDVAVDTDAPFYRVYGGTQDNFTLGGPARTRSTHGILNQDWFVTQDGDGFHCKVDPKDSNIVYAEAQYGVLVRYDRRTGERVGIQPQPGKDDPPLRWNWDSPLVLSPHLNTRLYFAANKVFRSDDRGDSWKAISPDLTRQLDRNSLAIMGKVWSVDTVAKNLSTSLYGNITALAESPKREGLLYAGTDDGLIQVAENGGDTWRKVEKFPGVPERTFVSKIVCSQHDGDTVYAAFDNHKMADFAPYLLKSTDAGKTWVSIAGDLPERGHVLSIAEDHVDPNLLFAGTEFALYFTTDGGKKWTRFKSGLPTIQMKDLAIQKQMNDLVVATFGRGFYVLDDYSPLRHLTKDRLAGEAELCPARDAWLYIESRQYGLRGKAFLGEGLYAAENPPYGATFTYHLKDEIKTRKQKRKDAEKAAEKKGEKVPYPTPEQLRLEDEEEPPAILLTIRDADGQPVRTLTGPVAQGISRVAWDLRGPAVKPFTARNPEEDPFADAPRGPLAVPGKYTVALAKRVEGVVTPLGEPREFKVVAYGGAAVSPEDLKALNEFQRKAARLQRATLGTLDAANALRTRLNEIKKALEETPALDGKWGSQVRAMERELTDVLRHLRGDTTLRSRNENSPTSIAERVEYIVDTQRLSLSPPTRTQRDSYAIAGEALTRELARLRKLIEVDLKEVEKALDLGGAPWTAGRLPEWKEK